MDLRIQIGDIVYFTTSDGSQFIGLEDPTSFQLKNEKDFLEEKFALKLIDSNIQNFASRCLFKVCTSKGKDGQQVAYGDKISFMLASSSEYLSCTRKPEEYMAFNKIELKPLKKDSHQESIPKNFSWKFYPRLKHRKQGGYVYQNDKISIQTCQDMRGFLKPMLNKKLGCSLKGYEFKVKCFYDVGEIQQIQLCQANEINIRAQDTVTLFNVETQNYFGDTAGEEEKSLTGYVEKLLSKYSHTLSLLSTTEKDNKEFYFKTNGKDQQRIYKEKQQDIEVQPFNSLYRIELEDPLSNDFLQDEQEVRIKHLQSGKYVTLIRRSELEKKTKGESKKKIDVYKISEIIEENELDTQRSEEKIKEESDESDESGKESLQTESSGEEEEKKKLLKTRAVTVPEQQIKQMLEKNEKESGQSNAPSTKSFIKKQTMKTIQHKFQKSSIQFTTQKTEKKEQKQKIKEEKLNQLEWTF